MSNESKRGAAMQHYRNNISDGWLFKQELRMFRNYMRNWKEDVRDSDFFAIFANQRRLP